MARPCIELNLENATLQEVRVAMDGTPTKKGFGRLQALLWLYEGKSREEVAALSHTSAHGRCCASSRPSTSPGSMA